MTRRRALAPWLLAVALLGAADAPLAPGTRGRAHDDHVGLHRSRGRVRGSCGAERAPLPETLFYELRAGAFPGSGRPDVAVHVPPGFDPTQLPGAVVYFHGWNGCVAAVLSDDDVVCSDDGGPRPGGGLARQIDEARVNAMLVAVELRADMPTGEPGQIGATGGMRELLRELLSEHLAQPLGCALDVDELDRVVVVAHSGGYQAAASAVAFGDLPQITEVDLLDAFYGADDVFNAWALDAVDRFDESRRFVDLYTVGGGTLDRSRALAALLGAEAGAASMLSADDGDGDLDEATLALPVVIKRVPRQHLELPKAYVRSLVEAAGFARVAEPEGIVTVPESEARRR